MVLLICGTILVGLALTRPFSFSTGPAPPPDQSKPPPVVTPVIAISYANSSTRLQAFVASLSDRDVKNDSEAALWVRCRRNEAQRLRDMLNDFRDRARDASNPDALALEAAFYDYCTNTLTGTTDAAVAVAIAKCTAEGKDKIKAITQLAPAH
jgi:hypothetical protein